MMGGGQGAYKGTIDCFVQTFKNDVRDDPPVPFWMLFPALNSCMICCYQKS
jgi:hypothetical protein